MTAVATITHDIAVNTSPVAAAIPARTNSGATDMVVPLPWCAIDAATEWARDAGTPWAVSEVAR